MPVTTGVVNAQVSEAALLFADGVPGKTVAGWYGEPVTDRATARTVAGRRSTA